VLAVGALSGPSPVPRGVALPSIWPVATLGGVLAVFVVHWLRGRRPWPLAIAAGLTAAVVAGVLVVPGASLPGLLRLAGLADRALVPGIWIIAITVAIVTALAVAGGLRPSPIALLAAAAAALIATTDVATVARGIERADALRDLKLYLIAGENLRAGLPVYQTTPMTEILADQSLYPFLYPPPVLALFAGFSTLPWPVVGTLWIGAGVAAGAISLRLLSVGWVWVPIFLLWPPFFEGIWAGNVAVPGLLILAAAVASRAASGALVLGPLLKLQAGLPALWLLRERLWRQLAVGAVVAAIICLATLPVVGLGSWSEWLAGLRAFQQSQANLPALYSFALPQVLPYIAYLLIAAGAVVWALRAGGIGGLRRLAIASVIVSPSLYRHGLLSLLPALVALPAEIVWLVLGSTATFNGIWIAIVVTAMAVTVLRAAPDRAVAPLAASGVPFG
jgi:hypothetical protein